MKKSVIISIGIVYIVAIIVVGLFGQKLHIYNPVVYATEVVCHSETYKEYTEEEKEKRNADGVITLLSFTLGMKVELKCQALPNNVTNNALNYMYETDKFDESIVVLTVNSDYTASLTFYEPVTMIINVKAADGHGARLRIKIIIGDFG